MAKYDLNKRFYKNVAASTSEASDYIPADGERLLLVNVGVSSSSVPSTVVCILWDPAGDNEVIISGHSETAQRDVDIELIGDGIKILRMCLVNDLTEPTYMGAFAQGVILS